MRSEQCHGAEALQQMNTYRKDQLLRRDGGVCSPTNTHGFTFKLALLGAQGLSFLAGSSRLADTFGSQQELLLYLWPCCHVNKVDELSPTLVRFSGRVSTCDMAAVVMGPCGPRARVHCFQMLEMSLLSPSSWIYISWWPGFQEHWDPRIYTSLKSKGFLFSSLSFLVSTLLCSLFIQQQILKVFVLDSLGQYWATSWAWSNISTSTWFPLLWLRQKQNNEFFCVTLLT